MDILRKNAEEGDYTPEQHLVAAVAEFKKLEATNQQYIERMYTRLSSPFKISAKPCETDRVEVLRCYSRALTGGGEGKEGGNSNEIDLGGAIDASLSKPAWQLPLHACYSKALMYQQCVDKDALHRHMTLSASFEAKRLAAQDKVAADMDAGRQ